MSICVWPENHTDKCINLSEVEFATLWAILDMPADWCGEFYPHEIAKRLEIIEPHLLARVKKDGAWTEYGIEHQRIGLYLRQLKNIVDIAGKEETKIFWE